MRSIPQALYTHAWGRGRMMSHRRIWSLGALACTARRGAMVVRAERTRGRDVEMQKVEEAIGRRTRETMSR
jgi:hypothetical protein